MFKALMNMIEDAHCGGLKYAVRLQKSSKLCKDCMKFYKKNRSNYDNVDSVANDWHTLFVKICKYFGINESSADVLWEDMCIGNWEHLWKTDEEEAKTSNDWLDAFMSDVFYCSDRWSLDRLMRCHWMYRQYINACND